MENKMKYGLTKETITKINDIFYRYKQVEQATLYGSRAKGNFRPGSDIDLTLKGEALTLKIMNRISLDLDELLLPYSFDISIFHQISNPDLIEHIEQVGLVFYVRQSSFSG